MNNTTYYCPPKIITKYSFISVIYEFFLALFLAIIHKPDIISGYLLFPHGLSAYIIACLTHKKKILSLVAGRGELFTSGSLRGIDFNRKVYTFRGKVLLYLLNKSDIVVTTGTVTKNYLVKNGIKENNIYPIISPPNHEKFYPVHLIKKYDLISVSRLSIEKHLEVFLKIIWFLKRSRYPNIQACIVGDGPKKREICELINEYEINNNVILAGYQQNVAYYYNSSKIFIHTSEREGFPNVVLEAMSCGLPCIVSNCGDIIDICKDGYNAIVISRFDDYESYAKAIASLLEDNELYNSLSKNALNTSNEHNIEKITKQWEEIIYKLKRKT